MVADRRHDTTESEMTVYYGNSNSQNISIFPNFHGKENQMMPEYAVGCILGRNPEL